MKTIKEPRIKPGELWYRKGKKMKSMKTGVTIPIPKSINLKTHPFVTGVDGEIRARTRAEMNKERRRSKKRN